jgi:hypothetical protein
MPRVRQQLLLLLLLLLLSVLMHLLLLPLLQVLCLLHLHLHLHLLLVSLVHNAGSYGHLGRCSDGGPGRPLIAGPGLRGASCRDASAAT